MRPVLPHTARWPALFCGLLALVVVGGVAVGSYRIPLQDLVLGLSDQQLQVLLNIRLPRVALGVVVGAALAVSGAALQGLFRNPLADPGLIGITSGAAFFASVCIVAGVTALPGLWGMVALSGAAFLGGLITTAVIFRIAAAAGQVSVASMLLAGIAINAMALAGINFVSFLSDDQQLRSINFWMMGSLGGALWPAVLVCAAIVLPAMVVVWRQAKALNLVLLGEDEARYLGVEVEHLKRHIILGAALCVGAAVAVSGIIVFVGLIVPHLVRLMMGGDHRRLLPASALLGASLMVVADSFSRVLVAPAELPVGILTGLIGGPFFLWLMARQFAGRRL